MKILILRNKLLVSLAIALSTILSSCSGTSNIMPKSVGAASLDRSFPGLDLTPILSAPAGEPIKRKPESVCPPTYSSRMRHVEDLPCIGSTGTSYPTPSQGIALEAYWFIADSTAGGSAFCKIATLSSRANAIANSAMNTLRGTSAAGGGLFSNISLIQKAASIADNPYKAQRYAPYGIEPDRLQQIFGTAAPSAAQVSLYNLIGKIAPATGTNSANFLAGNANGDQMYIQQTNMWLSSSYGSMLQQNLANKWFVSIYSSSNNYLKTMYATNDQGVIKALISLINQGGIVSDNVNPDYDLNDSVINCYG